MTIFAILVIYIFNGRLDREGEGGRESGDENDDPPSWVEGHPDPYDRPSGLDGEGEGGDENDDDDPPSWAEGYPDPPSWVEGHPDPPSWVAGHPDPPSWVEGYPDPPWWGNRARRRSRYSVPRPV